MVDARSGEHGGWRRLAAGERFAGRYDVEALLGEGGMGAVYRATDRALAEPVALKVLLPLRGVSDSSARRFRQEVKLSRRVTHANVIRVYDIGEHDELLYMTMEFIEGRTLRQELKAAKRLAWAEVLRLGRALCDGLSAVHAHGIVHRDLKPSNVMIDPKGRVILADFGVASGPAEGARGELSFVGTLRYMAPEQFAGAALSPRVDLYALGLLLHEALTGDVPARELGAPVDPGAIDLVAAGVEAPKAALAGLGALLRRCLALDPGARPASADEVGLALAAAEASPDPRPAASAPAAAPGARRAEPRAGSVAWAATVSEMGTSGIAVLPFRHVGPPEHAYLGMALASELSALLAQSRGLKVLGPRATLRLGEARDPLAVGAALGVFAVVDVAVHTLGERPTMHAWLFDARSGAQLWAERYEGTLAELLALQSTLVHRIASTLRVELTTLAYGAGAPPEAIDHYLAARRDQGFSDRDHMVAAFDGFSRCLRLAPDLLPALSAHAMTALRCWFLDRHRPTLRDWEAEALKSVDRAMRSAPELPETHLAAAMFATQRCEFHSVVRSLTRALTLAPMFLEAQEYLGMLELEADRVEEGYARLSFANDLDPSRSFSLGQMLRYELLLGQHDRALALLDEADRRAGLPSQGLVLLRMRTALWHPRRSLAPLTSAQRNALHRPRWGLIRLYSGVLDGSLDAAALTRGHREWLDNCTSLRGFTTNGQLICELFLWLHRVDEALAIAARLADVGLIDLVWLERCPALDPLRRHPAFADLHRKVALRVQGMFG